MTIIVADVGVLTLVPQEPVRVYARPRNFFSAIHGRSISEVFILLITIDHDTLEEPIRIANDTRDTMDSGYPGVISQGYEWTYFPFQLKLPNLEQDTIPASKLVGDNVSREITLAIQAITTPPSVRMQICLSSDPNIIEYDIEGFVLNNVSYDVLTIEGDLTVEYFMSEPYPSVRFTPSRFPGLFRGRATVQAV